MADDLDDILNSALDEVEDDEQDAVKGGETDLSQAAQKAAEESAETAKQAKEAAANAAAAGMGGVGAEGFEESAADLLKQLDDPEFAKSLEEVLKTISSPEGEKAAGELFGGAGGPEDEEIAKTLQALAENAKGLEGADAASAEKMGEEIMQQMMKQFEQMGQKDDFPNIIESVMQQLLSKDVMYDPIKQVVEKFPEWLANNEETLEKEEYERYGKQYQCYMKIIECYDTEPDNMTRISELMQQVQEYGQPPVEIIKDLAPGLEIGPDGIPNLPGMGGAPGMPPGLPPGLNPEQMEGCAQQ